MNPFTSKTAGALMPGEWESQQRQIDYERRLAEKLMGDSEQPQGQMVGGFYVAPSWTQHLAKALNPLLAERQRQSAEDKQRTLDSERQSERMGTLDRFSKAMQGTPATPGQDIYTDDYTAVPAADQQGYGAAPAVPGDRNAAMAELGKSRDPQLQNLYMAQMLKGLEPTKPVVVGRTLKDPVTGKTIGIDETWQAEQRTSREEQAALRRELAQMADQTRRDLADATRAASRDKAPSGYRFNPDGSLAPITGGPADPKAKTGPDGMPKLTEAQGKANLYQSRATESDKIMSELEGQYSPMAINAKQGAGKVWGVGGALEAGANVLLPAKAQKVEQAQRDFVNAILRQESGAVISDAEFANAQKQYFPQPGDSQAVMEQKRKNRSTAIAGLKVMAGPAANIKQPVGIGSQSVSGQIGGFKVLGVEE